ncbi:MAG: Putative cytochrome P450 hydroxylase, partial [uncultured Actinomycetospora sp.]
DHPARGRPRRPLDPRLLGPAHGGAGRLVRRAPPRAPDLLAPPARGHAHALGGRPGLLGGRAPRRHRIRQQEPRALLLGAGRAVPGRAARAARGDAVVPGDGRAAAHPAAQDRQRGVHAQAGPPRLRPHRRARGVDRRRPRRAPLRWRRRGLRRAGGQAPADGDDLRPHGRAGGVPGVAGRGRRPARRHQRPRRPGEPRRLRPVAGRGPGADGPAGPGARARERPAEPAAGRPHDQPGAGRGRRPAPARRGDRRVLRAALGGRQRHDAQHHRPRDAPAHRAPGAARVARRGRRGADGGRGRGVRPAREPRADLPAHRGRGHRAARPADLRGRQGRHVLRVGQPGRRGVRRPAALRPLPRPQPARRLRGWRTPLLPGQHARAHAVAADLLPDPHEGPGPHGGRGGDAAQQLRARGQDHALLDRGL